MNEKQEGESKSQCFIISPDRSIISAEEFNWIENEDLKRFSEYSPYSVSNVSHGSYSAVLNSQDEIKNLDRQNLNRTKLLVVS